MVKAAAPAPLAQGKQNSKTESVENIALPDFLEPRKHQVYGSVLKIRAKRLLDRDLTGALEAVCDLVVEEYTASGKALTEESINGEVAEATVSLAMQTGLYRTNTGPYTGPSAIYRGGVKVKVADLESFSFDFRLRLRKKLDRALARVLDPQIELVHKRSGTTTSAQEPPSWAAEYRSSRVVETTAEERAALTESYRTRHLHPEYGTKYLMKELHWLANVSRRAFDGWRRAEIDNNSKPGKRILDLLVQNIPAKHPKYLPERARE